MLRKRDGDLYRIIFVNGRGFEIRYGYYEDFERESGEPVPIYPDLGSSLMHGEDGRRVVTAMQDVCPWFEGECSESGCWGCRHFEPADDLIGICNNDNNRMK